MSEWKTLREQAGLTLAELAKASGYSTGTINGLELHGEGSERLKERLREVLTPLSRFKESATSDDSESVTSGIELRETSPEYGGKDLLRRAEKAEAENAKLKQAIRALLGEPDKSISYSKPK